MKLTLPNGDDLFFTADTHFYHKNLVRYANLPFSNASERVDLIVERWNDVVSKKATVFHLGDFAFGKRERAEKILKRLNGKIHIVYGNHDATARKLRHLWASESEYVELTIKEGVPRLIVLCHYPFRVWRNKRYGAWHLHGHCHGNLENPVPNSLDVGIDLWDFRPVAYSAIAAEWSI